jgi:hypothetical protein
MNMDESSIKLATAIPIAAALNQIEGAGLTLSPAAIRELYAIAATAQAKAQRRRHALPDRYAAGRGVDYSA